MCNHCRDLVAVFSIKRASIGRYRDRDHPALSCQLAAQPELRAGNIFIAATAGHKHRKRPWALAMIVWFKQEYLDLTAICHWHAYFARKRLAGF